jgi:hypothetical protein
MPVFTGALAESLLIIKVATDPKIKMLATIIEYRTKRFLERAFFSPKTLLIENLPILLLSTLTTLAFLRKIFVMLRINFSWRLC